MAPDAPLRSRNPGYLAAEAAKRAEKRRQQDARRAELLAEFGSFDAVLKPCVREKALLAAVKPLPKAQARPHQRWTKTLAGFDTYDNDKAPDDLVRAIEAAFPMPTTYADAKAEAAYWTQRNDDIELALRDDFRGDYMLDQPCLWRWWRVCELVEHGLHLRTLPEIVERMRAYRWNETGTDTDVEDALLRDVDALVARANDGDFLSAIRRSIASLAGCEDAAEDYCACVLSSCSCMKATREIASLVAARERAT